MTDTDIDADTASSTREVCALLADGSTVRLRPACPRIVVGYVGSTTRCPRTICTSGSSWSTARSGEQAADRLCAPPESGHHTLVAVQGDRLVGIAEYETCGDPASAEIALAVADQFHHRGIGTLLLQHPSTSRVRTASPPSPPMYSPTHSRRVTIGTVSLVPWWSGRCRRGHRSYPRQL
ncbi:GNAT family N-acetyltransferase [Streptomyces sp. NPDC101227]|uniref:GNAT family N-acetyltransferase n=1 Tax=Streptomyces sp. NPDC101227 TaxID=3366136 RepID=UPI00380C6740